jgi:hypothetical protein
VSIDRVMRRSADGDRLSRLLARWADARRLTPRQAEAIRLEVLAEPATNDFDWWWRLLDPDGGAAFRGLGALAEWETSAAAFVEPVGPTTLWPAGVSMPPTWDHEAADFQPYLRLT